MGCNLKDLAVSERVRLPDLAGKRVGIDAFLTAFQFLTTMRDRSPKGDGMPLRAPDGRYVAHLMGFLQRTCALLEHRIIPVYVFDGDSPALKADELAARRERRQESAEQYAAARAAKDLKHITGNTDNNPLSMFPPRYRYQTMLPPNDDQDFHTNEDPP